MTKDADVPLEYSYFYTTRKDLDSLAFNAEKAEYDIKTQQLKVSGIPYIVVADARITPDHNEVLILKTPKSVNLKTPRLYWIPSMDITALPMAWWILFPVRSFQAMPLYQYVNAKSDTFAIKMTDFHLEPIAEEAKKHRHKTAAQMQTVAKGAVDDKAKSV